MRIGIDCRELRTYQTGIGRILLEFLREARRKAGDFDFVLFGNEKTNFLSSTHILENYKKIMIREKMTLWWDQIQLRKALWKNAIDVFFSPYYKMPLFTETKTVLSIFDVTYLLVEPYSKSLKSMIYLKNFVKLAAKKAEKILTSSHSTKKDLTRTLHLSSEKIEVVYLGINPEFRPTSGSDKIESVKRKYGIWKKYVLSVGNFSPHKNHRRLIRAFELLPDHLRKDYSLVLAGGQPERLGIRGSESLLFPGYIAEEDLPSLYSGAELFVFPSLYEGFGLPPLEAMACGCPVASSNTSCLPEVLADAALFFNPCQVEEISRAIGNMLEDGGLREEFRQKGLERARLFSSSKMTEKLISLFESVYRN